MIILDITLANHNTKQRFIHAVQIKRAEDVKQIGQLKSLLAKQVVKEAKQMEKEINAMTDMKFKETFLTEQK